MMESVGINWLKLPFEQQCSSVLATYERNRQTVARDEVVQFLEQKLGMPSAANPPSNDDYAASAFNIDFIDHPDVQQFHQHSEAQRSSFQTHGSSAPFLLSFRALAMENHASSSTWKLPIVRRKLLSVGTSVPGQDIPAQM